MNIFQKAVRATVETAREQKQDIFDLLVMPIAGCLLGGAARRLAPKLIPGLFRMPAGNSRFLAGRQLAKRTVDGAVVSGADSRAWAKYAIKKGLPTAEDPRSLLIENEPHRLDDFNGVIKEGYGKGTKELLYSGNAVVKIKGRRFVGKVNYHRHAADRAGLHYDLVVEGVSPDTGAFELNIPSGPVKGRYAIVRTIMKEFDGGRMAVWRGDHSVRLPKPDYRMKDAEWLKTIDPEEWIVEVKADGSMANAAIKDGQGLFRSHRDAEPYFDKLPGIEDLYNKSRLLSSRFFFPRYKGNGTVLQVELYHPQGASKVSGVLNSHADKARGWQEKNGDVKLLAWDIAKFHGRDQSNKPYEQRRALLEEVISDIRRFNKNWDAIEQMKPGTDPGRFYDRVISRSGPLGEGVVVKHRTDPDEIFYKVKRSDLLDLELVDVIPGTGKYEDSAGALLVRSPNGETGKVGSFKVADDIRQKIYDNRDSLRGLVVRIEAMEMTDRGVPRAGRFVDFHPDKNPDLSILAEQILCEN